MLPSYPGLMVVMIVESLSLLYSMPSFSCDSNEKDKKADTGLTDEEKDGLSKGIEEFISCLLIKDMNVL